MAGMEHTRVPADSFHALDGVDDWRVVLDAVHATFRAGSFTAAAELVRTIAEPADAAVHHPDVALRYPDVVHVALTTHDAGGPTTRDVELARRISERARAAGAKAEPTAANVHEIAIDTMDADR